MSDSHNFELTLEAGAGYRFEVDFLDPAMAPLLLDEPPPLGEGAGPNAARVLAAAVANCLSASLLFCLRKAHAEPDALRSHVTGTVARNGKGRLRVAHLEVAIELTGKPESLPRFERCLGMFENFCVVTASVRPSIPMTVIVRLNGEEVHRSAD